MELLHRFIDALDGFLGSPSSAGKIESNYDVVSQIASEICDAGIVCNTEPNALQDVVEVSSWMESLLGGIGLPSSSPGLVGRGQTTSLQQVQGQAQFGGIGNAPSTSASGSAIPWRKSNVRHTSNELYVDIVESLSAVVAPSGRPITAFVHGTIAFTCKISGVPELLLLLSAQGGKAGISNAMGLPKFHPCVRLARWRDRPGELSFVPPDGRFVLAGYECDLLPDLFKSDSTFQSSHFPNAALPLSLQMRTYPKQQGEGLEVQLAGTVQSKEAPPGKNSSSMASSNPGNGISDPGRIQSAFPAGGGHAKQGRPGFEDITTTIHIPPRVKNVVEIRCSKGEACFIPGDSLIEWHIPARDAVDIGNRGSTLRCTLVGPSEEADGKDASGKVYGLHPGTYEYDETADGAYQGSGLGEGTATREEQAGSIAMDKSPRQSYGLAPRSATISFGVKGWLASGIKVDSLSVNTKTSKGIGPGVMPYKGVKYHTISRQGLEIRR